MYLISCFVVVTVGHVYDGDISVKPRRDELFSWGQRVGSRAQHIHIIPRPPHLFRRVHRAPTRRTQEMHIVIHCS